MWLYFRLIAGLYIQSLASLPAACVVTASAWSNSWGRDAVETDPRGLFGLVLARPECGVFPSRILVPPWR